MKNSFSLFFIYFTIITVYGQETLLENNYKKIGFEVATIASGTGFFFTPITAYNINKHSISIGPKLPLESRVGDSFGLICGYKFYPNGRQNKVNFHFSFNSQFLREVRLLRMGDERKVFLENTFGYGFELKLFKELYLTNEVGGGIMYRWIKYEDNQNYLEKYTTGIITLGIRKRFKIKH
ncbi:MAG: hypothetical protein H0V01_10430 [Bacteroidetes bacterium]|nr:hypothetical protein [Bacteroidota bacterium]HET6245074.1 hypothetical protein [Bacteroidia bacterium]